MHANERKIDLGVRSGDDSIGMLRKSYGQCESDAFRCLSDLRRLSSKNAVNFSRTDKIDSQRMNVMLIENFVCRHETYMSTLCVPIDTDRLCK